MSSFIWDEHQPLVFRDNSDDDSPTGTGLDNQDDSPPEGTDYQD